MIEKLEAWKKTIDDTDYQIKLFCDLLCANNSELVSAVERLQCEYTQAIADLVGDDEGWLMWFWLDNHMGLNKFEAGFDGNLREIVSLDDLAWLIDNAKNNDEIVFDSNSKI